MFGQLQQVGGTGINDTMSLATVSLPIICLNNQLQVSNAVWPTLDLDVITYFMWFHLVTAGCIYIYLDMQHTCP